MSANHFTSLQINSQQQLAAKRSREAQGELTIAKEKLNQLQEEMTVVVQRQKDVSKQMSDARKYQERAVSDCTALELDIKEAEASFKQRVQERQAQKSELATLTMECDKVNIFCEHLILESSWFWPQYVHCDTTTEHVVECLLNAVRDLCVCKQLYL